MPQELTKKEYSYELRDEADICSDIEERLLDCNYICDTISECADSCVDIYNYDLWKKAQDFQEWTEEAIDSGLCETGAMGNTDMIKIFMAGQYQYYTQMAYDNMDKVYYNCFIEAYELLSDEDKKVLNDEDLDERFEDWSEQLDHNDGGSWITDKLDEFVEECKDEQEDEDEEDEEEDEDAQ